MVKEGEKVNKKIKPNTNDSIQLTNIIMDAIYLTEVTETQSEYNAITEMRNPELYSERGEKHD